MVSASRWAAMRAILTSHPWWGAESVDHVHKLPQLKMKESQSGELNPCSPLTGWTNTLPLGQTGSLPCTLHDSPRWVKKKGSTGPSMLGNQLDVAVLCVRHAARWRRGHRFPGMGIGCSVCADCTGGQPARLVWAYGALDGSEELVGDVFLTPRVSLPLMAVKS